MSYTAGRIIICILSIIMLGFCLIFMFEIENEILTINLMMFPVVVGSIVLVLLCVFGDWSIYEDKG